MYCSKCGTQIEDDACFCYKCGRAVTQHAPQNTAYQPNNYQPNDYQPNNYQANNYQPGAYQPNNYQPNNYQPNQYEQKTYDVNQYEQVASYSSQTVKDGVNVVYPDGHSEIGDIYISATEIVFVKKSKAVLLAFGMIGNHLEKGTETLRFPTSDIVGGQRTRIGLNVNVYQITLRNGETYRLCMNHPKTVTYLESMFG